jgi:hypothetical protein
MSVDNAREFFETLPARVGQRGAQALDVSYRFDVEGAGRWRVESDGVALVVTESDGPADCVIRTDEQTYMTGKVRVEGALGLALKLRELFA